MPGSTARGYPFSLGSDTADTIDTTMQSLAEMVDARPGVSSLTTAERNALAGAAELWDGRIIWNRTTARVERYNLGTNIWIVAFDTSAAAVSYAGSTDIVATNVEAALDELDSEKLSVTAASAAYLAKAGGTVTGDLTVGDADTDLLLQRAVLIETHARSTTLAYTGADLTSVTEKAGATTVRTTTLTYSGGNLTQTVEVAGGKTITTTLTYDGSGTLTGTTRTVA